ncbi:MAG: dienelactone hydrolase family protein [Actinomycetota bacterium]
MTLARSVTIELGAAAVPGDLVVPDGSSAVVVFAHGSGSGRDSPRNRQVARRLQEEGLGTLLLDLLTPAEEEVDGRTGHLRFDVDLLAGRLVAATQRLDAQGDLPGHLSLGYFGASTGAAAALVAAASQGRRIGAVVSRGGRPDLAGDALPRVTAPTLLVVGGRDAFVLDLNRQAADALGAEHRLEVVPGATHLFEEPGALERVADLAAAWFRRHLAGVSR